MDKKEARNIMNSARQEVAGVRTHFETVGTVTPEGLQKLASVEKRLAELEADAGADEDAETRADAAPVKASKGQAEAVK